MARTFSQLEISFDQNFSTSQYNKNMKTIIRIKDVKNIHFAY